MQEILIILLVALIVIGPKRLPELAKTLGKGLAEFRKAADDLQETVRMDLQKEQQEEFRRKYPDLVPDGDEEEAPSASTSKSDPPNANARTQPPGKEPEPEPVYDPAEIEGGDESEDDTRDG